MIVLQQNRFKPIANQLANRFSAGMKKIPVKNINVPDMTEIIEGLGRYENFSVFIPKHRELGGLLLGYLLGKFKIKFMICVSDILFYLYRK